MYFSYPISHYDEENINIIIFHKKTIVICSSQVYKNILYVLNILEHVKIKNSIKNFSASEHCLISRTWLSAENIPTKHVSMFLSNRCFLRTIMYNNEAVWSIEALTNVRHLVQDIYTDLKTYCRKANQVHRGSIIQLIRVSIYVVEGHCRY